MPKCKIIPTIRYFLGFRCFASAHISQYSMIIYLCMSWIAWSISWSNIASQREERKKRIFVFGFQVCEVLFCFYVKVVRSFLVIASHSQLNEIHVRCAVQLVLIIVYIRRTPTCIKNRKKKQRIEASTMQPATSALYRTQTDMHMQYNKTNICLAKWATRVSCCWIYN